MSITAKELAEKLNLSQTAVSMALNNKPGVSTETRRMVVEAAEKYGYDFTRLSLKKNKAGSIYAVSYRSHNAIMSYSPIFDAIQKRLEGNVTLYYTTGGEVRELFYGDLSYDEMLVHYDLSVKFTVDRGVSHELVRHRIASFAQESTRYCNYGHEGEISVIEPFYFKECRGKEPWKYNAWVEACCKAEDRYLCLLEWGASPQEARAVLPNSLKTEIVVTANLREWRNIFKLRAVGVTGKPHPQMLEVMVPLLEEVKKQIPVVFDDLVTE